jgi:hypothetical protein
MADDTPQHATPQHATPEHATPEHATPEHGNTTLATPVMVPASPQFTEAEAAELRRRLHDEHDNKGASRFGWFLIGFVAAIASIAVAALVFLAVSDEDDDGNINLDVPSVEIGG